jgi:hypothetical protein
MEKTVKEVVENVKKTNPHNLVVGDRVHFTKDSDIHIGNVSSVYEEKGTTKLDINLFKGDPITEVDANSKNLEHLSVMIAGSKVPLRFTYRELIEQFNKGNFKSIKIEDLKANKKYKLGSDLQLLKGERSKVFKDVKLNTTPGENKPENDYVRDVRFEMKRDKNNIPSVHIEESRKKLDLSQMYGRKFSETEIKQLEKTGNLGLVDGFTNKGTGEIFKAWIGVDKGLNKLMATPEWKINVNKIRGNETTPEEQESLKQGKGIIRGKGYYSINGASTSNDSVSTNSAEYAIKNKYPMHVDDEKKKAVSKTNKASKTKAKTPKI